MDLLRIQKRYKFNQTESKARTDQYSLLFKTWSDEKKHVDLVLCIVKTDHFLLTNKYGSYCPLKPLYDLSLLLLDVNLRYM